MKSLQFILPVLSFCLIAVPKLASCQDCTCNIYINDSYSSNCSGYCSSNEIGGYANCRTLMDALRFTLDCSDYVYYNLPPGDQYLESSTPVSFVSTISHLHFVGEDSTVTCMGENTGWNFANLDYVGIHNMSFENCRSLQPSTTRNLTSNNTLSLKTALYFNNCVEVKMESVNIRFTDDTMHTVIGAILYNPGTTTVSSSHFSGGSNGLALELTTPTQITYSFSGCSFVGNVNTHSGSSLENGSAIPTGRDYNSLNKGGGMSIVVKGSASENMFEITDCLFEHNQAHYGGGLFASFLDRTYDNQLIIKRSNFTDNVCPFTGGLHSSGGGLHFEDLTLLDYSNHLNGLDLNSFVENKAFMGGAVFVNSFFVHRNGFATVHNTNFTGNSAIFGSALYASTRYPFQQRDHYLTLKCCTFNDHSISYPNTRDRGLITPAGLGTVYSNGIDIHFQDSVNFTRNVGSAVVLFNAMANFSANCQARFVNNSATRGGAMALFGSYILTGRQTQMIFEGNEASLEGGAIYHRYPQSYIGAQYNWNYCFVKYEDESCHSCDPNSWQATFQFFGNKVLKGTPRANSIHSTSILPCKYRGDETPFCWDNWLFGSMTCDSTIAQVTTDSNVADSVLTNSTLFAHPGWPFEFPIHQLRDDNNQSITDDLNMYIAKYNAQNQSMLSVGSLDTMTFMAEINDKLNISIESLNDRSLHFDLEVTMKKCPPGFIFCESEGCVCPELKHDGLYCDADKKFAVLDGSFWIGPIGDNSSNYYIAPCPFQFCSMKNYSFHILPNDSEALSEELCQEGRTGVLCGECEEGYCLAVNTWRMECINETKVDLHTSVLKYASAVYLPFFAVLVVISLFHIQLTMGSLNAFVLFAQMMTTSFDLTEHDKISLKSPFHRLPNIYRFLYGPFNLNFLEKYISGVCFSLGFNTLSVFLLDYLLFIFPILCVILSGVVLCIYRKMRRYREDVIDIPLTERYSVLKRFRVLSKPHHETFVLLLSTLVLLSYTRLSDASAQILYLRILKPIVPGHKHARDVTRVHMAGEYTSNDPRYLYYKAAAILGEIYLVFLMLLLLDYPLRILKHFLRKTNWPKFKLLRYPSVAMKYFIENFQECFRPQFRCFAGLYFGFRYTVSIVRLSSHSSIQKYVVQEIACIVMLMLVVVCKPYRENIHNIIDVCIFTNLAVINALNFYQHDYYLVSTKNVGSSRTFILQYTLAIIPVMTLVMCLCWRWIGPYVKEHMRKHLAKTRVGQYYSLFQSAKHADLETEQPARLSRSHEAALETRGEDCSAPRYHGEEGGAEKMRGRPRSRAGNISVTVVDVVGNKGMGEAMISTSCVTNSEGYYLRKDWDSAGGTYGAIN